MPKETFFNLAENKRLRIVELAIEEFSTYSFTKASISRIVARAGIAKGSFYQYFENKLDLYRWLLLDFIGKKKMTFLQAHPAPAGGDFFDNLAHLFLTGLKFGLANPRLAQISVWVMQSLHHESASSKLSRELQRLGLANLKAILQQGQASGQVREDIDLDLAADVLMTTSMNTLNQALIRKIGVDMMEFCTHPELAETFGEDEQRALIEGMIDILRRGLGTGVRPDPNATGNQIDLDSIPNKLGAITKRTK